MKQQTLTTDNISELLIKIIEFTNTRQKILTENINNVHTLGFIPRDLDVNEFSALLHLAIDEHLKNQRLLLRDTDNVKFGPEGLFEITPVIDNTAKRLLDENKDAYVELQVNKLVENALNQRFAAELFRQKQQIIELEDMPDGGCCIY